MAALARDITPILLIPLAVLTALICFFCYYWSVCKRGKVLLAELSSSAAPLSFSAPCHPMARKDLVPVVLITLIYAFTAFFRLGATAAPQSFLDLKDTGAVELELSERVYATALRYYPGLGTGDINVEISSDREHWSTLWPRKDESGKVTGYFWADAADFDPCYALPQHYADLFKWLDITPENPQYIRYIRLTGKADWNQSLLELGELSLLGQDGQVVPLTFASGDGAALVDEQSTVPDTPSWYNSSYFDEIYHARTAYEHIRGIYPYEVSHPPLGKLIISLGIRLFGMTPFGWRFMGTLFGVLMVPLLYLFLKNLFGKTAVAACGSALFAFDFMHLTQTRIATIDTYAVFFILLMYYFLYRYLALPKEASFRQGALWLFLSGLFWGIGIASKWTVVYGGLGLAVLYFIGFFFKLRDWPKTRADGTALSFTRGSWVTFTLLFSVLCFILLPLMIYTASYLPYAQARGVDLSLGNTLKGFGESFPALIQNVWGRLRGGESAQAVAISKDSLPGIMADNQWYMLTYHQGVTQTHPYSSRWFQWLVDARPILYYMDNSSAGYTSRFAAFNNPIVCWGGLLAVFTVAAQIPRRVWAKGALLGGLGVGAALLCIRVELGENGVFSSALPAAELSRNWAVFAVCLLLYAALAALLAATAPARSSGKALFILVGWLSQLAPWLLIGRTTFEYHYFPSLIFLVLAIAFVADDLSGQQAVEWKKPLLALTGGSFAAYLLFYPLLTGLTVPTSYSTLLGWLPSWPF